METKYYTRKKNKKQFIKYRNYCLKNKLNECDANVLSNYINNILKKNAADSI